MKARNKTKKVLSLLLATVMVLTLIPVSALSVFATTTALSLDNYDTQTEFIINTLDDWNTVAAATDKDFAGKTVKLGTDISGVTTTLFNNFAGTFDGGTAKIVGANVSGNAIIAKTLTDGAKVQNVIFSGATLTNTTTMTGLITGKITGGALVSNVTLDGNITVTGTTDMGGVVGCIEFSAGEQSVEVSNIHVLGTVKLQTSITATADNTKTQMAFVVCAVGHKNDTQLTIKNVSFDNDEASLRLSGVDSAGAANGLGGVLSLTWNNGGEGNTLIENVEVQNTTLFADKNDARLGVGGVVAKHGCGTLQLKNIVLNGLTIYQSGWHLAHGGVIGTLVSDCTIDGITSVNKINFVEKGMEQGGLGGLIGTYYPANTDTKLEINNVSLKHLDINMKNWNNRNWTTSAGYCTTAAGGLIGIYEPKDATSISMKNIAIGGTMDITVYGTNATFGSVGGVIGIVTKGNSGKISIENLETALTINNQIASSGFGTGAVIGSFGLNAVHGALYAKDSELVLKNAVIGGSVTGRSNGGVGGVIGYSNNCASKITMDNVLISANIVGESGTCNPVSGQPNTYDAPEGLVIGGGNKLGVTVNMLNCSAVGTTDICGDLGTEKGYVWNGTAYEQTGATITLNGKAYTATTDFSGAFNLQRDSLAQVTALEAPKMVQYTDAGFVKKVDGHLAGDYEQHTAEYGEEGAKKFDIRFITVTHVDVTEGYTVNIKAKTADKTLLFKDLPCEAYTTLTAYGENGLAMYDKTPADLGGRGFIAVLMTDIPAGVAYEFEVTVSYTTASGITMTDVNTLYVSADGTFSSTPV